MSRKRAIIYGSGVIGGLTILILLLGSLTKNLRFFEQPVVVFPAPDPVIVGIQVNAIKGVKEVEDEARFGRKVKAYKKNSSSVLVATPTSTSNSLVAAPTVDNSSNLESNSTMIRVSISGNRGVYDIASSTELNFLNSNNQVLGKFKPFQKFRFSAQSNGIQVGDKVYQDLLVLKPNDNGLLFFEGSWYRGSFALSRSGDTLIVVNYLPLEEYLSSVVGCEMPGGSPPEALKAQAIASRSYAVSHINTAQPFDLGSTQQHQVYKGVRCEVDATRRAVNETVGLVLTSSGKVMRTMYASDDQTIKSKQGGGQSMSQVGAIEKAKAGLSHAQILESYYPGGVLKKL